MGCVFLPAAVQLHVLPLSLRPSDLGSSFEVRVGIWEDLVGRCVSGKPEHPRIPRNSMGVISEVILWHLCGLVCGCVVKRSLPHPARLLWPLQLCWPLAPAPCSAFTPSDFANGFPGTLFLQTRMGQFCNSVKHCQEQMRQEANEEKLALILGGKIKK